MPNFEYKVGHGTQFQDVLTMKHAFPVSTQEKHVTHLPPILI